MKFNCKKEDLLNAVNVAIRGIPNKTTMPILSCFLLSASGDLVKINATDTELGVVTSFDAKVSEDGDIALDAKLFSDIVKRLPEGDVSFESDDTTATVKSGKTKINMGVRNSEDYPSITTIDKSNVLKMTQESLKDLISQVIFSVAQNGNNVIMSGVHFRVSDNKLTVTALDGHRIAIRQWQALCDDMQFIIPSKTLIELSKVITEGDIDIYYTDTSAMFDFGNSIITTRLIAGDYFDIAKVITDEFDISVKVDRKTLIDCLDRATLMIREGDRKPVIFTISDTLNIKVQTPLGSTNEDIEIEKPEKELVIGLNPRFLMDALRVIGDSEVTLYFNDAKAPCHIKGEDYRYVVLPINFN